MITLDDINKIINGNILNPSALFNPLDSTYLYTTENIKGYIPNLDDKKVLTVTSSGDHYFNSLLFNSNEIDLFDINKFSLEVLELKKAAIEGLEYNEYLNYIGVSDKNDYLNYNLYLKFRDYLSSYRRFLWDYIYLLSVDDGNSLYFKSNLFINREKTCEELISWNSYLEEDKYYVLKEKLLKNKNFNFYYSDIFDLPKKINKKYDYMFFSNIQDYVNIDKYIELVFKLSEYLEENGKIYFAYLYDYQRNMICNLIESLNDSFISKEIDNSFVSNNNDKVMIYVKH